MSDTAIDWAEKSWNPVTGCTKKSEGCDNCYAERMAKRLKNMGQARYENGFRVTTHESALSEPEGWTKPSRIFVCSMSDLFHEYVTDEFIKRVFETMNRLERHTFLILTKRPERLAALASELQFTANIWVGVTVEHPHYVSRIEVLRTIPAAKRWISCEPLLEDLTDTDFSDIDWIVVGGESGPGARPMDLGWARGLKMQCEWEGIAFFYKQQGAKQGKGDKRLDGVEWHEYPGRLGCVVSGDQSLLMREILDSEGTVRALRYVPTSEVADKDGEYGLWLPDLEPEDDDDVGEMQLVAVDEVYVPPLEPGDMRQAWDEDGNEIRFTLIEKGLAARSVVTEMGQALRVDVVEVPDNFGETLYRVKDPEDDAAA